LSEILDGLQRQLRWRWWRHRKQKRISNFRINLWASTVNYNYVTLPVTVTLLNRVHPAAFPSYRSKFSLKIPAYILSTYSVPEYNSQTVLLLRNRASLEECKIPIWVFGPNWSLY
jgi:hypothetical protein